MKYGKRGRPRGPTCQYRSSTKRCGNRARVRIHYILTSDVTQSVRITLRCWGHYADFEYAARTTGTLTIVGVDKLRG